MSPVRSVIGLGTSQDIRLGFQALYLVRRAISKISRTRFTPKLGSIWVGTDQSGLDALACFSVLTYPSLPIIM